MGYLSSHPQGARGKKEKKIAGFFFMGKGSKSSVRVVLGKTELKEVLKILGNQRNESILSQFIIERRGGSKEEKSGGHTRKMPVAKKPLKCTLQSAEGKLGKEEGKK